MREVFANILTSFVDKLILMFALIYIAFSTEPRENAFSYVKDFALIAVVVILGYLIVIFLVNLFTLKTLSMDTWSRIGLSILMAGFIMWLYPLVLTFGLLLVGVQVGTDVQQVLLATMLIRALTRFYLHRLWK